MRRMWFLAALTGGVATLLSPGLAGAAMIDVNAGAYGDYGHLANAGGKCAATATINSFQFLANKYKAIGATKLIPGAGTDLASARDKLDGGWGAGRPGIGGCPVGGKLKGWWEAKNRWIDDYAPGTITTTGMLIAPGEPAMNTWYKGKQLINGTPSLDFLYTEIKAGEDVELAFDNAAGNDHAITLTGFSFNDKNNDGKPQINESPMITYLDPNNASKLLTGSLVSSALNGGSLGFTWDNGSNPKADVSIYLAFAESPVPEPGPFWVIAPGLLILLTMRTRVVREGTASRGQAA